MVKYIFVLYNGRVTNRDPLNIAKKIYYPVGYVWEKIFDKLLTDKTLEDRRFFKNFIIETGKFAGNPLTYGFGKIYYLFNKNRLKPVFQSSINDDR